MKSKIEIIQYLGQMLIATTEIDKKRIKYIIKRLKGLINRKLKFEINNDLDKIVFNFHNSIHLFGALILVYFFGFWIGYGAWLLWEIGDGFKPWYYKFKWNPGISWLANKFRQECLYSDKFSLQDVFVWNLAGALIGLILRLIF